MNLHNIGIIIRREYLNKVKKKKLCSEESSVFLISCWVIVEPPCVPDVVRFAINAPAIRLTSTPLWE